MAQAWFLKSRPSQVPARDSFELRSISLPPVQGNMVHVRNTWFSVDPYMRARMNDVKSYIAPFSLDDPLDGLAVGEVVAAPGGAFAPGDVVTHRFGWRDEVVADASAFTKIKATDVPPELYLNTLGMIGATAYFGLTRVAKVAAGETLFVSAAAGAVGSLVVQIAKLKGMRVVASAGGAEKCNYVLGLGADAAIDYKTSGALSDKLRQAAPDGIDVYFDNVGGEHLDAAMGNARDQARFAICGMIDMYNAETPVQLRNLFKVISARLHIQGFIVGDFRSDFGAFERDMHRWVREGKIVTRETVMSGLESAPDAFLGLFEGKNLGKMLVRL